jgi:hypothetical protein
MGIVNVKLYEHTMDEKYRKEFTRMAASLFELNFDIEEKSMCQVSLK